MCKIRAMRLFYQTKTQNAQAILKDGFRDSVLETTDDGHTLVQGVRLFDDALGWPLGVAMDGNTMLSIEIPEAPPCACHAVTIRATEGNTILSALENPP